MQVADLLWTRVRAAWIRAVDSWQRRQAALGEGESKAMKNVAFLD